MNDSKGNLKNKILPILIIVVLLCSAFIVVADDSSNVIADTDNSDVSGDVADDGKNFSDFVKNLIDTIDVTVNKTAQKDPENMTIITEDLTVDSLKEYDKTLYINDGVNVYFKNNGSIVMKDGCNIYIEGKSTFFSSGSDVSITIGSDSYVIVGGIGLIKGSVKITSPTIAFSGQYNAINDDKNSVVDFRALIDIQGTNADSVLSIENKSDSINTIEKIINNPDGADIEIGLKMDLTNFVNAYGKEVFDISSMLNVLKDIADKKSNMPLVDLRCFIYKIESNVDYIQHEIDKQSISNLLCTINTNVDNKHLVVSVKMDEAEYVEITNGRAVYSSHTELSKLALSFDYGTVMELSLNLGGTSINKGRVLINGDYNDEEKSYSLIQASSKVTDISDLKLKVSGSQKNVLDLIDAWMQDCSGLSGVASYLKENKFSIDLNVEASGNVLITDKTSTYYNPKIEKIGLDYSELTYDFIVSNVSPYVCHYYHESEYKVRISISSITLSIDTEDNVMFAAECILGDSYLSVGDDSSYGDEEIDFSVNISMERISFSKVLSIIADTGISNTVSVDKVKNILSVLSESNIGPYSFKIDVNRLTRDSHYKVISSREIRNDETILHFDDLVVSIDYNEYLTLDISLGKYLYQTDMEEQDSEELRPYSESKKYYAECSSDTYDEMMNDVKLKFIASQNGILKLLGDSIIDSDGKISIDTDKIFGNVETYGAVSVDLSVSEYKLEDHDITKYVDIPDETISDLNIDYSDKEGLFGSYELCNRQISKLSVGFKVNSNEGVELTLDVESIDLMSARSYDTWEYDRRVVNNVNEVKYVVNNLSVNLEAEYSGFINVLGALIKYNQNEKLTEEQIKSLLNYLVKNGSASLDISFDKLFVGLYGGENPATLKAFDVISIESDSIHAGADKTITIKTRIIHTAKESLNSHIDADIALNMNDSAFIKWRGDNYHSGDFIFEIKGLNTSASMSGDVDFWKVVSGDDSVLKDTIGKFTLKTIAKVDSFDLIKGTENGLSFTMNDAMLSYRSSYAEAKDNWNNWMDEGSLSAVLSNVDNKIGSITLVNGVFDAEKYIIDKTKPYVEVTLYDGKMIQKGSSDDVRYILSFAYRTVFSNMSEKEIDNTVVNGKHAGNVFVFNSTTLYWSIFENGKGVEPEYKEKYVYAEVPSVKISGINEGTYPAGTQFIVSSDKTNCKGWIVNGKLYNIGETVTITSDSSITEKMADKYTVTFMSMGGVFYTVSGIEGTPVAIPNAPKADGYEFMGWDITVSAIGNKDVVVTALWSKMIVKEDTKIDYEGNVVIEDKSASSIDVNGNDLKDIADTADGDNNSVDIKLSDVSISFPKSAIDKIVGSGDGKISIKAVTNDADSMPGLNDDVRKKINNGLVVSIDIKGAASSSDLGKVKVYVPYDLKEGEAAENITIYYMDGNGVLTKVVGGYDSKASAVWFETSHFSDYVILSEASDEDGNDNTLMYVAIGAVVAVIIIGCVLMYIRSNRA